MTFYEVWYCDEVIYATRSYEDALKKVRQLYAANLDDRYKVVRVVREKED